MIKVKNTKRIIYCALVVGVALLLVSCSSLQKRMEVTAYCGCRKCCNWERGSWKYLKLNFWNKYISKGNNKGKPYTGRTASGKKPKQYDPGIFSTDSIKRPYMIPLRLVLLRWLPRKGTIAADTRYYPFGTKIYVPGYGRGVVADRGGAIKGPNRLDLFYRSHNRAKRWGRKHITVKIKQK